MREIKFRAWDKENDAMVYQNDEYFVFEFSSDGLILTTIYQGPDNEHCHESEDAMFMQFTGLLDKNGKDIYEGDILLWDCGYKHLQRREVVTFDNGRFYSKGKKGFGMGAIEKHDDGGGGDYVYEIIGNIYENESLLADKPDNE